MPEILRYVDPSKTGGTQDGQSPDNAFLSLRAWLDSTNWEHDLTQLTSGDDHRVIVRSTTALANLDGAYDLTSKGVITGPNNRLIIEADSTVPAASGGRHEGQTGVGARITTTTTTSQACIETGANCGHLIVRGMGFVTEATNPGTRIILNSTSSTCYYEFDRCHIDGNGLGSRAIECATSSTGTWRIRNTICQNGSGTGIRSNVSGMTCHWHNVTVHNWPVADLANSRNFHAQAGTANLKNCLATATHSYTIGSCSAFSGGTMTNCCSTDTSAAGTAPQTSADPANVYVDHTAYDLRLKSTDTKAKDNGVDLSGDSSYAVTVDIIGTTRSAPFDIGAFEFIASTPFTGTVEEAGDTQAVTGDTPVINIGMVALVDPDSQIGALTDDQAVLFLGQVLAPGEAATTGVVTEEEPEPNISSQDSFSQTAQSTTLSAPVNETESVPGGFTNVDPAGVLANDDLDGHAGQAEWVTTTDNEGGSFQGYTNGALTWDPAPNKVYSLRVTYRINDLIAGVSSAEADVLLTATPISGLLGDPTEEEPVTNITEVGDFSEVVQEAAVLGGVTEEEPEDNITSEGNFTGISQSTLERPVSDVPELFLGLVLAADDAAVLGAPTEDQATQFSNDEITATPDQGDLGVVVGEVVDPKWDFKPSPGPSGRTPAIVGSKARLPSHGTTAEGQGTVLHVTQVSSPLYDHTLGALRISDSGGAASGQAGTNLDWSQVLSACYDPVTRTLRTVEV